MPRVQLPNGQQVEMSDAEYRAYQQRQQGASGPKRPSSSMGLVAPIASGVVAGGVRAGLGLGGNALSGALTSTTASSGGSALAGPVGSTAYNLATSAPAASAAAPAATGAAAAAPTTAAGVGSTLAAAAPYLGLAGMGAWWGNEAKDVYDTFSNDTSSDDTAGAIKGALLSNPMTFWAAPFVGMAGIRSGKGEDQMRRDGDRKNLRNFGILDDDYRFQMPDGTYYDLGSERLRATSTDPDKRGDVLKGIVPNDRAYNINWDTADHDLVGALNPLAYVTANGDEKRQADLVGQFYNMAMQSDDPYAVVEALYSKFAEQGLGRDQMAQLIQQRAEESELDASIRDAYISGVDVNTRNQLGQSNAPRGRYQQQASVAPAPQQSAAPTPAPRERQQGRPRGASSDAIAAALGGSANPRQRFTWQRNKE